VRGNALRNSACSCLQVAITKNKREKKKEKKTRVGAQDTISIRKKRSFEMPAEASIKSRDFDLRNLPIPKREVT
jgi:hypothetical protein